MLTPPLSLLWILAAATPAHAKPPGKPASTPPPSPAAPSAEQLHAAHLDFARAMLAEQRGDDDTAAAGLEKARSEDPGAAPLVRRCASILMAHHDVTGATALYRDLAARDPGRLSVQVLFANFLLSLDRESREALTVLEAAHKRFPEEVGVIRQLFRLYEKDQRDKAMALYHNLAALDDAEPEQVLAASEFAKALFPKDDKEVSSRLAAMFREALMEHQRNASFARAASDFFRDQHDLPAAIEALAIHAAAAPWSLEMRTRLGILLLSANREAEGEKELLDVLAVNSRQALAHQSLAKLYRQQGRVADALPHAAEALKIRSGDPSDFLDLATELLDASRAKEARLLLERAVYFHPSDASLVAKLAIATRRDPQARSNAPRLFREAEQLSTEEDGPASEPEFLAESSEALIEGGELPAAEEQLRRAIRGYAPEKKKETAAAMRRLAALWRQQGKNDEAAAALLKRAQALDPSS